MINKQDLIGNEHSKVFHKPECYCVPYISRIHRTKIDDDFRDEKGKQYRACGKCFKIYELKQLYGE